MSNIHWLLTIVISMLLAYQIYISLYFTSKRFQAIKISIEQNTKNCNDLNHHIENLKTSYSDLASYDYGESILYDDSNYNMNRKKWKEKIVNHRTYNCSAVVCKNANSQPFKYLCKYFNIKINEATLSKFEDVQNNFTAAEQGKVLLKNERDEIISSISNLIPPIILTFSRKRLISELGFNQIDFSDLYFPVYIFQYISAGGNSSSKCIIKLDIQNLDKLITYLGDLVKFKNSVAGQRSLMTSSLREKIKQRDSFTCKICGLSVNHEKNLLLEIDHIMPISRGGVTSEENLQTLCWKCNRSKGAKIIN